MRPVTRIEIILGALHIDVVKNHGRRAWALCPFHDDHSADNFFVRTSGDRAGTFHCFACKEGGGLAHLVMKIRNVEFKEAKAFIAKAGKGFEPPRARVRVIERPAMLTRMRFELPRECIMGEPLSAWVTSARRYAEKRGITQDEVERYGLGYAVDGRLGGRIIFPVRAPGGRVVSYSARSFASQDPKYQTPFEDENADLDGLFGEHLWPEPDDRRIICVTEGAINALSCVRASGYPSSSISGSHVRPGHVVKLSTFKCVVLFTDPDKSGDKAARGFASSLGRHTTTVRGRLPRGKDANDLGRSQLYLAINRAIEQGTVS